MERPRIVPFNRIEDLRNKTRFKNGLSTAQKAISMALEGRGDLTVPDDEQRQALASLQDRIEEYAEYLLAKKHQTDDAESIARTMTQIKASLATYLSEEQFVEIFGPDNLA